jgi:hypothetical protein
MNKRGEVGFRVNAYSKRVQKSERKSDVCGQPAQPPNNCPECNSSDKWKDGIRYRKTVQIQRFICRDCVYRFSVSSHMNKNSETYSNPCRVCVSDGEMKNLAAVETKTEVRTSPIAEKIVNYLLYLKRIGRKESTIETYNNYINILRKSNLEDPEAIALFIHEHWTENSTPKRSSQCL